MPTHTVPNRPTGRAFLTSAVAVWLGASVLYLAGGCAHRDSAAESAKNSSALDSYVQGVLAYQKGDTTRAMADLTDAVNKKNDLVMARSMLGDLYRSKSDYDAARQQYEAVTRLDPYEYVHHYHLGLVYQFLNRLQEAAASYLAALDLKPTDAASNMSLGTVYFALNDPAKALPYAERAVQFDPKSAAAWVNLGLILDANTQFARAEEAYRKSLDLDSSSAMTRLYLGENLLSQNKPAQARGVFAELVKVEDTPLHRKRLGDAYLAEGNYKDALTQYQAALKLDPVYYPALNEIGVTYASDYDKGLGLDESKRKAALDAWQQSLSINRAQPRITALVQKYSKRTPY
jgi:tetratricopeptide (TPR) repeat protein